jgi:hypothetical protein
MYKYMLILVISLNTVNMFSPAVDMENALYWGAQEMPFIPRESSMVGSDILNEERQTYQRKSATEGFQNGLDWIHLTGGGKK